MTQELSGLKKQSPPQLWLIGKLIALFELGALGALIFVVGLLVFTVIDTFGITSDYSTTAVVTDKYTVAPPRIVFIPTENSATSKYASETYRVSFRINDQSVSPRVSRKFFDRIEVGDEIHVAYGRGKLTGWYKPTCLTKMKK